MAWWHDVRRRDVPGLPVARVSPTSSSASAAPSTTTRSRPASNGRTASRRKDRRRNHGEEFEWPPGRRTSRQAVRADRHVGGVDAPRALPEGGVQGAQPRDARLLLEMRDAHGPRRGGEATLEPEALSPPREAAAACRRAGTPRPSRSSARRPAVAASRRTHRGRRAPPRRRAPDRRHEGMAPGLGGRDARLRGRSRGALPAVRPGASLERQPAARKREEAWTGCTLPPMPSTAT